MENINMIVGWKEWVSLPDLEIPAIMAKIDTGALTSSIHAYNIEYFRKDGERYVRFELHPLQKNHTITRVCEAKLVDKRHVKNSGGDEEKRPVIKTKIAIGGIERIIELNLTNRDAMGMRMLIGRKALKDKMLVNPSHRFLFGTLSAQTARKYYNIKKGKE